MTRRLEACWEQDFLVAGNGIASPIAIESAGLVIAHAASKVHALELEDGALRYQRETRSTVNGLAVGVEAIAIRDGFDVHATIAVLDAATGEVRREIGVESKPEGLVATANAFAWVEGNEDAEVLTIADASGDAVSRVALPAGSTSYLYAHGDRIVACRYRGGIVGSEVLVANERGEILWRAARTGLQFVDAITESRVVALLSGDGVIASVAFDAANGEARWHQPLPLGSCVVVAGDDLIYVEPKKARVERRDPDTGAKRSTIKLRDRVSDGPVLASQGGVLWVQGGSSDDEQPLRAFDVASGELVATGIMTWSHGPAIALSSTRVIVNERASSGQHAALRAYVNPFG